MNKLNNRLQKERDMYLYNLEMILGHVRLGTISKDEAFEMIRQMDDKMEQLEVAHDNFMTMIEGMFDNENQDTSDT